MPLWERYHTPNTVAGTLASLARYDGKARIIAGGTDLLIDLQHIKRDEHPLAALVDITSVPEMTRVAAIRKLALYWCSRHAYCYCQLAAD